MKRIISLFAVLCLLATLAACGSSAPVQAEPSSAPETSTTQSPSKAEPSASDQTNAEKEKKSLVVYFSWSGNTRNVAESIQKQTGSDIFEIVPKTPYSTSYNTVVKDAKAEQQNNARPEIKDSVENIGDYDTIYVGFPNWWGDMPMILYTFFDTYDLSGKTVALFCTSGGSGLSNTVNEVKNLEPNATVTEGLHIGSGSAASPDNAVANWLSEIKAAK